jgi:hypothetical protein
VDPSSPQANVSNSFISCQIHVQFTSLVRPPSSSMSTRSSNHYVHLWSSYPCPTSPKWANSSSQSQVYRRKLLFVPKAYMFDVCVPKGVRLMHVVHDFDPWNLVPEGTLTAHHNPQVSLLHIEKFAMTTCNKSTLSSQN